MSTSPYPGGLSLDGKYFLGVIPFVPNFLTGTSTGDESSHWENYSLVPSTFSNAYFLTHPKPKSFHSIISKFQTSKPTPLLLLLS